MKVVVWNENIHEKVHPLVTQNYPGGIHGYIKSFLECDDVEVTTATLDDPECGLTNEVLDQTDVLLNGVEPDFTPVQGVNMIKILEAMYKSAETGMEVRL